MEKHYIKPCNPHARGLDLDTVYVMASRFLFIALDIIWPFFDTPSYDDVRAYMHESDAPELLPVSIVSKEEAVCVVCSINNPLHHHQRTCTLIHPRSKNWKGSGTTEHITHSLVVSGTTPYMRLCTYCFTKWRRSDGESGYHDQLSTYTQWQTSKV